VTARRIQALEALVERGATEGEREAARIALEKHKPKVTQTPPRSETPRFRSNMSAEAFAQFFNDLRQRPPDPFRVVYTRPQPDVEYFRTETIRDAWTQAAPKPEPRVTQMRQATVADYRNAMPAVDGSDPDTILIMVATLADTWLHFKQSGLTRMFNLHGKVWQFSEVAGVLHDQQFGRCYLKIDRRKTRPMMVPM
jgi:hypothetical protein